MKTTWIWGLGVLLLLCGCGYRQEIPRLPAGAQSIAVDIVENHTSVGELDVRLRALLEHRLQQHAYIRMLPLERSALAIKVELSEFTISRVLDPAVDSDRTFTYSISGSVTLTDQRNNARLIQGEAVSASVSRLYAATVEETPAIRDEGIDDVVALLAEQVEQRLLRVF